MTSFGFYAYPWNFHNVTADFDEMVEYGMRHVAVASSYHAGKFIQPRDKKARVYFPEDGMVYFQPRRRYGKLTPLASKVTQERDILEDLCATNRMPVRAWTVLNHNSRLGWTHPDTTVKNAFGDPYYYSLCPANPDVKTYAINLCADLAEYDLESLLLETPGWLTYGHGYHHEFAQVPPNPWFEGMLGLCFCPHCISGAKDDGIDADGLRRRTCSRLNAFLLGEEDGFDAEAQILRDLVEDPDLQAFIDWRCDVVTGLVRAIRAEFRSQVKVKVISTCQRPHATTFWEGGDLKGLCRVSDGLELPIYQPSTEMAAYDLNYVVSKLSRTDDLSVILRPGHPDMTSQLQLSDTLAAVQVAGINDISFYNYGMLKTQNLKWLKACVKTGS